MNGYSLLADTYRKQLETGKIDRETAENKIKALDFLGDCTKPQQLELFNSGAFNDTVKGYLSIACDNLKIDKKGLLGEIGDLFDTVTAEQAESYYKEH